jgi:hypothetical protein
MPRVEGDVRWHHGQTLAAGQVAEFKVWAELVRQSMGGLHVFLPLRDRGIDGVLHRMSDGAYYAVQIKGRTSLTPAGQVHITVTASSLVDDAALVMAVLVEGEELGEKVLVVDELTFRSLAAHDMVGGREYLTAAFGMHATSSSRWAPYLVPRERLAERFGRAALTAEPESQAEPERQEETEELGLDRGREGLLGEAEVIRRLVETNSLNLFRPFPDLEIVEVLVRHVATCRYLGLQVKTAGFDAAHLEDRVYLRRSSFRAGASTFICVLGWDRAASRFSDHCLLIPSEHIVEIARVEGEWLVLELEPGSTRHRRLDRYQVTLESLGQAIESLLG